MIQMHEPPQRALKRMLANGPMTAMPKRFADQELLALLAAARFAPTKTYTEAGVNELLESWLATFTEPHGIDHVSMRRLLVDLRLLTRTSSGSLYEVNVARKQELEAVRDVQPAEVLAAVRVERDVRKKNRPA